MKILHEGIILSLEIEIETFYSKNYLLILFKSFLLLDIILFSYPKFPNKSNIVQQI